MIGTKEELTYSTNRIVCPSVVTSVVLRETENCARLAHISRRENGTETDINLPRDTAATRKRRSPSIRSSIKTQHTGAAALPVALRSTRYETLKVLCSLPSFGYGNRIISAGPRVIEVRHNRRVSTGTRNAAVAIASVLRAGTPRTSPAWTCCAAVPFYSLCRRAAWQRGSAVPPRSRHLKLMLFSLVFSYHTLFCFS